MPRLTTLTQVFACRPLLAASGGQELSTPAGEEQLPLAVHTRPPGAREQTVGIQIEDGAGEVNLEGNQIDAKTKVEDQRKLAVQSP